MQQNYLATAQAARRHAWDDLKQSPAFAAFKAFDDAVAALGGPRVTLGDDVQSAERTTQHTSRISNSIKRKRVHKQRTETQADVAFAVLKEQGRPLMLGEVMEAVRAKGAKLGGKNPVNNFRSVMSRDKRFYSRKLHGAYVWWLTGKDLPEGLDDTAGGDLLALPAASSVSTNWKGGEANATATH